jgi:hypothetical protein
MLRRPVAKNAIPLIDSTGTLRARAPARAEALVEAGRARPRPGRRVAPTTRSRYDRVPWRMRRAASVRRSSGAVSEMRKKPSPAGP